MENNASPTIQDYDRYMENLADKLHDHAISVMAIVEECGCRNYQHTGDRYIISITKNENT